MLQIVGSAPGFPHGIVDPIEVFDFFRGECFKLIFGKII